MPDLERTFVMIKPDAFQRRLSGEIIGRIERRGFTLRGLKLMRVSPEQANQLPPLVHEDFLHAFANALQGVFLFGMVLGLVPFVLSWLLKEVPLRTTLERGAELTSEEAVAAATPDERVLAPS